MSSHTIQRDWASSLRERNTTMEHATRRQFLRRTLAGSLVCTLAERFQSLLGAQAAAAVPYDLLIKGGRVVDPSQKLSAVRDVAIAGNKIARVAENIAETEARQVLDAQGQDRDARPDRRPRPRLRRRGAAGHPRRPHLHRQGRDHRPRRRLGRGAHVSRLPQARHQRRRHARLCPAEHLGGRPIDPVPGQPARRAAGAALRQSRSWPSAPSSRTATPSWASRSGCRRTSPASAT